MTLRRLGLAMSEVAVTSSVNPSRAFPVRVEELVPGLIVKSIPDMQPSFDQFAAGLKAEAERTAA